MAEPGNEGADPGPALQQPPEPFFHLFLQFFDLVGLIVQFTFELLRLILIRIVVPFMNFLVFIIWSLLVRIPDLIVRVWAALYQVTNLQEIAKKYIHPWFYRLVKNPIHSVLVCATCLVLYALTSSIWRMFRSPWACNTHFDELCLKQLNRITNTSSYTYFDPILEGISNGSFDYLLMNPGDFKEHGGGFFLNWLLYLISVPLVDTYHSLGNYTKFYDRCKEAIEVITVLSVIWTACYNAALYYEKNRCFVDNEYMDTLVIGWNVFKKVIDADGRTRYELDIPTEETFQLTEVFSEMEQYKDALIEAANKGNNVNENGYPEFFVCLPPRLGGEVGRQLGNCISRCIKSSSWPQYAHRYKNFNRGKYEKAIAIITYEKDPTVIAKTMRVWMVFPEELKLLFALNMNLLNDPAQAIREQEIDNVFIINRRTWYQRIINLRKWADREFDRIGDDGQRNRSSNSRAIDINFPFSQDRQVFFAISWAMFRCQGQDKQSPIHFLTASESTVTLEELDPSLTSLKYGLMDKLDAFKEIQPQLRPWPTTLFEETSEPPLSRLWQTYIREMVLSRLRDSRYTTSALRLRQQQEIAPIDDPLWILPRFDTLSSGYRISIQLVYQSELLTYQSELLLAEGQQNRINCEEYARDELQALRNWTRILLPDAQLLTDAGAIPVLVPLVLT